MTGLTASPYTDTTVSGGTTYSYEVTAVDSTGGCESLKSGCASATATGSCTTPGTPTIGTVTAPGNNQLTVTWTAGSPAGATYNIYRANGACPGGTYSVAAGVTSSPWTDSTVIGGQTYSYKVTAVDGTGVCESPMSGCASATATTSSYAFIDDQGKCKLCVNGGTGAYTWTILTGTGVGSYAGTAKVTNTTSLLLLASQSGAPQFISFTFSKTGKVAVGSFRKGAVSSTLHDSNTANNPAGLCP